MPRYLLLAPLTDQIHWIQHYDVPADLTGKSVLVFQMSSPEKSRYTWLWITGYSHGSYFNSSVHIKVVGPYKGSNQRIIIISAPNLADKYLLESHDIFLLFMLQNILLWIFIRLSLGVQKCSIFH